MRDRDSSRSLFLRREELPGCYASRIATEIAMDRSARALASKEWHWAIILIYPITGIAARRVFPNFSRWQTRRSILHSRAVHWENSARAEATLATKCQLPGQEQPVR